MTSDVVYRAPGSLSSSYQTVDSKCEVSVFTEGNGSYHFASRLVDLMVQGHQWWMKFMNAVCIMSQDNTLS